MRKRKEKTNPPETLVSKKVGDGGDEVAVCEKGSFFSCYLLTSLSPRHKGHTYIGFTVNPRRRIRQHNGEIGCGAWRTKRKRPWEMVMCIYGFPTNVSALQFEWAWQHPKESLAVRKAAAELKYLSGVASKIKLAYTMLGLPSWQSLNLTVNFFSTKYATHCADCPSLPDHMKVQVQSMDHLPCYDASLNCSYEDEYDFSASDELNHPGSPTDVVPGEIDAACCNSSHDPNDKAENGTLSDLGQEQRLSSDMSDMLASTFNMDEFAKQKLLQMPTDAIQDCSWDGRKTLETGTSSRQQPTDEKYWSILDETSTWDSSVFAQQKTNSYNLHDLPISTSAALGSRHDSVIFVNDLGACRSNGVKSTPASWVIDSCAEVEVIDLMTPSPDCRVILSKKKRDPSIIDLTRSPNFIQL